MDKRWTRGGATKRQPLKKAKEGNVEEVKESDEQILEEGMKGDSAGVKHDDVSGRGDNVSVNIDARVGGFDDITQEEDWGNFNHGSSRQEGWWRWQAAAAGT